MDRIPIRNPGKTSLPRLGNGDSLADLSKDVPGLLDAALVRQHGSNPVSCPDIPRIVLQNGLKVVNGPVLVPLLLLK